MVSRICPPRLQLIVTGAVFFFFFFFFFCLFFFLGAGGGLMAFSVLPLVGFCVWRLIRFAGISGRWKKHQRAGLQSQNPV